MHDIPSYEDFDPYTNKLLIIDDYDFTKISKDELKRLSELMRFGSTHCNMSIIVLYQSWFRLCKIIKDMCNVIVLYKPHDQDELHTIGRRIGLHKDQIQGLFDNLLTKDTDSLMVNFIKRAPYKYAKNLFQPIPQDLIDRLK